MNIRQLEAFREVMVTGSVTRAADRMGISQPAVSKLIAQLERSCGFKLFERRGTKLHPTREGEALHAEVQHMFVGVGRIARVAMALRDQNWGSIRIASFPAIGHRVIPEIALAFSRSRPNTRFQLQSMRSRSLIDAVATQNADIAVSSLPGDRPEVDNMFFHKMRGICIMPASHPLGAKTMIRPIDLANEPFVSLGTQDHSRLLIERVFDEAGITLSIQMEAGQSEIACTLVAANAGVAIVDPFSVHNHLCGNLVARPFTPEIYFPIWLLTPRTARSSNVLGCFLDFLSSQLMARVTALDEVFWARGCL